MMPNNQHNYYDEQGVLAAAGFPRVSTILDVRHKRELGEWKVSIAAEFGAEEVHRISDAASSVGTLVHEAIETYINTGDEIVLPEDYTLMLAGREVVKSPRTLFAGFQDWFHKQQPTHCYTEVPIRSKQYEYAGRTDLIMRTIDDNGELQWWLVDFKTSKNFHDGMGLQLAAYKQAYFEETGIEPRTAILQLTADIQRGYRWREYDEPFGVFLAHKKIFDWEQTHRKPVRENTWDGKTLVVAPEMAVA